MTNTQKLVAVGVAAGVAAGIALALAAYSSSASTPAPVPTPTPTTTPTWQRATTLRKGVRYRVSASAVPALKQLGFTVLVPGDAIPADWPADDLDPKRYRVEGQWVMPDTQLPSWLPADAIVYEYVPPSGGGGIKNQPTGTWTRVTYLRQGQRYRASADLAQDVAAHGFTLLDQHDQPPADWPSDDLGPDRWRVDGVWTQPDTTVGGDFTTIAAGRVYELV